MALEIQDVSFSYDKQHSLYQGVSFSIDKTDRVALSAPSGFGKTTLCKLIAGFLHPDKGQILVDGTTLPLQGVRPVQMIWQHPEQVLDPRMRMKASLLEAGMPSASVIEGLGIKDDWMNRYPHELSGGELQRFCIARALSTQPRYLLADEISTMLDAVTQAQIWNFLIAETTKRGIGMLFVSHSPALTARVSTRIIDLMEMGLDNPSHA